jgi:hypothetical protein
VLGCLLRTGRRSHDDPSHRNALVVRDLRSGAVVRRWARHTGDRDEYDETVKRFALGPHATLAWLVERLRNSRLTYRVYAWGSGHKPTLLDPGADSSSGIRLEHGCVHWVSGGQPRAACPPGLD